MCAELPRRAIYVHTINRWMNIFAATTIQPIKHALPWQHLLHHHSWRRLQCYQSEPRSFRLLTEHLPNSVVVYKWHVSFERWYGCPSTSEVISTLPTANTLDPKDLASSALKHKGEPALYPPHTRIRIYLRSFTVQVKDLQRHVIDVRSIIVGTIDTYRNVTSTLDDLFDGCFTEATCAVHIQPLAQWKGTLN